MVTVRFAKSRQYQVVPGTMVQRPLLPVRLGHGGRWTPDLLALLDSGADMSVFHADIAIYLGIDLATCQVTQTGGIGGVVTTYICPILLEVDRTSFNANVMFSRQIESTIALLGRDNVFDMFRFGFDQRSSRFLLDQY